MRNNRNNKQQRVRQKMRRDAMHLVMALAVVSSVVWLSYPVASVQAADGLTASTKQKPAGMRQQFVATPDVYRDENLGRRVRTENALLSPSHEEGNMWLATIFWIVVAFFGGMALRSLFVLPYYEARPRYRVRRRRRPMWEYDDEYWDGY